MAVMEDRAEALAEMRREMEEESRVRARLLKALGELIEGVVYRRYTLYRIDEVGPVNTSVTFTITVYDPDVLAAIVAAARASAAQAALESEASGLVEE